jgi:predicted nucleic acid-binding protein
MTPAERACRARGHHSRDTHKRDCRPALFAELRDRIQSRMERDRDRAQEARAGADIMRAARAAGLTVPPPDAMRRAVALYRDARAARDNRAPRTSAE